MFNSKLKFLAALTLAGLVFILAQTILTTSAQTGDKAQINLTSLWISGDAPAFFNLSKKDDSGKFAPASCVAPPSGLVAWYRGENDAADSQGINSGTLENGAGFAGGKVGQAFDLDGIDDEISINDAPTLDFGTNSFTVETWANADSVADYQAVATKGFPSLDSNNRWELLMSDPDVGGIPRLTINTANNPQLNLYADAPVVAGQWYHLAFVIDRSANTARLYINGALQSSQLNISGLGSFDSGLPLYIGSEHFDPTAYFDGRIDELSIYNRALSTAEIQTIFNAGNAGKCVSVCTAPPVNQVSWWRGENDGSDSQGANGGTLQDHAGFTIGIVGQAFRFAVANAKFIVPASSSLNVGAGGELTLETWIKPLSMTGSVGLNGPIFEWNQGQGLHIYRADNGGFYVNLNATDGFIEPYQTSGGFLNADQFSHVAFTYSRTTGFAKIFVNGVEIDSRSVGSHSLRTTGALSLGARGQENYNVNAVIDEPAIYNRALSQTEIQAIFNAGSAGKCLSTAPLQIAPATANVLTGATRNFTASGGTAPYTFSIFTSNSGGSISASTGVYTAGTTIGTDTIRVTDANNATADATVNVSSAATRLAFIVQPTNRTAGQAFAPPVQVAVRDEFGNMITNSTAAISLSIQNNPNGGTLAGTVVKNAVNGVAIFDDLNINRAGNDYTLRAVSNNLTSAVSNAFNITPDVASQIVFVTQPSDTLADSSITPAPQVALQDRFGNTRTDISGNLVTIAIGNNPGGGTLSGNLQSNFQNGIASFPSLIINNAGNGYTLIAATAGQPSAASANFNIISQFAVTNTNDSGAGSLRQAMNNANTTAGTQTITFNIAGAAPFKITPTQPLPLIREAVIIDATTQPGFNGSQMVEISGEAHLPGNTSAIEILSGGVTIKGLVINRWVYGLRLNGFGNIIQGNYIGTDATGNLRLPNTVGIYVNSGSYKIGGATAAERNLISGNSQGIYSATSDSTINEIQGNYIGTKADGISALGNNTGIVISANPGSTVIGESAGFGAPNVIAFNQQRGIDLESGSTEIRTNSIHSNGGLGIDIPLFGANTNDPLDADEGANGKQNYPVITSVTSANSSTVVRGTLNSTPSATFGVRLYANDVCDASGFGEGKTFLGARGNINTDAGGLATFTITLDQPVPIGSFVTATANTLSGSANGTSEFSRCQIVAGSAHDVSGSVLDSNNVPVTGAAIKLQGTSIPATLTDSNGIYRFRNLPSGFNYTIAPTLPSVVFAPANRVINNLSTDQINQDFSGTRRSRVSGQITSVINGASFAVSGATVTLSGATGATVNTDVNGNYVFNDVRNGSYTATPTKAGFAFTPSSTVLNVQGDRTANFSSVMTAGLSGRLLTNYIGVNAINADGSAEIYLLNGLGGTGGGCVRLPCQVALDAKLSPDGAKIAYLEATQRNFPNFDFVSGKIYITDFDGSNRQLVYNFPTDQNLFGNSLGWSPDGTKLVFTVTQNSIRTVNTDGTNETIILAVANQFYSTPEWSPDGAKILFTFNNNRAISTIDLNGTNRVQLTSDAFDDGAKWSPNGAKIAFIRRPQLNSTGRIFTMNADGTAQTALTPDADYINVLWSPDGAKLAFTKRGNLPTNNFYGVVDPNGANPQIIREISGGILSWSPIFAPATPTGANVSTNVGASAITFNNVSNAGTTTITPIPYYSVGTLPNGYFISGNSEGYEITTTAIYTAPVTVCLTLPTDISESHFNRQSILHRVNGVLIDETTSRDYPTRQICATTTTLSPFVIAEQINANAPSITGLIQDADGKPLVNIPVHLSGAETAATTTDSDGFFTFANLTTGANYNVQPKQIGYLFSESNQDFINLTGENAVVFEGAASDFQISGRVTNGSDNGISGVTVNLGGAAQSVAMTDANGDYVFSNLPADGFYTVTPSSSANLFSPNQATVNSLTSDVSDIDFQTFAPTAASISIAGRVILPSDLGLRNALVTLTDSRGNSKTILTGKFGSFRFTNVSAGDTYIVSVSTKHYAFVPQIINPTEDIIELIFTADYHK